MSQATAVEPTAITVAKDYKMPPTEIFQEVICWPHPDMTECYPGYVVEVFDREITAKVLLPGGGEQYRYSVVHKNDPRIPYFDQNHRWINNSGLWDYAPQVKERREIKEHLARLDALCELVVKRIADLEKKKA